jgi:integrase
LANLSKFALPSPNSYLPSASLSHASSPRRRAYATPWWLRPRGRVEVKAHNAKTQAQQQGLSRRLVPVQKNLVAWLKDYRKERGPVCEFANITKQLLKLADDAGMKWKHNALRHSYISYRVAECADVPRVADESGNSSTVIRTNYLRRVKPKQAAAWFSIVPGEAGGKIIAMKAA